MNIMSFTAVGLKAANGIPNSFCFISLHLLALYYDQAVLKDYFIKRFLSLDLSKAKCKVWIFNLSGCPFRFVHALFLCALT